MITSRPLRAVTTNFLVWFLSGSLLGLAGCSGPAAPPVAGGKTAGPPGSAETAPAGGTPKLKKKYVIAVIPKGTTHDFWKSVHAGADQAAKELGIEIIWDGTVNEKDKEGQIKIIQSMLTQVDGICLAPIDRTALIRPVEEAKQAGVPTVVFDSGLDSEDAVVSYVATDNRNGGKIAAEKMGALLKGKGNVIMLRYAAGSESTEQREEGFLDTLREKFPEIKVVSENQRVGSDADEARRVSESLLNDVGRDLQGVFTVCEPNNKGMLVALENNQLAGKVQFIGFDSDPRFIDAMKEGKMQGIVLQDPVRMGYLAVKTIVAHLEGQPVEKRVSTGELLATPENLTDPDVQQRLKPAQFGG